MLDVLVTCRPYEPEVATFPQVRGYYLAKHLARTGLLAEFHQLPQPSRPCKVLICSEYQCEFEYFQRELERGITEIDAETKFCMIEYSLARQPDHFSRAYCDWFTARGGVLVQRPDDLFADGEHWIGVGVDRDVVDVPLDLERNRILFDFPRSGTEDASATFDPRTLDVVRARLPDCTIVGTGPADSPIRAAVDVWIAYGQTHAAFTQASLPGVFAFVPGWEESLGLQVAEAQVAGACIVSTYYQVPAQMRCPQADVRVDERDPVSLANGLLEARTRDPARIRAEAAAMFDYFAVAKRTRKAIGF